MPLKCEACRGFGYAPVPGLTMVGICKTKSSMNTIRDIAAGRREPEKYITLVVVLPDFGCNLFEPREENDVAQTGIR